MARDDEEGDEAIWSGAPLPPEDRVWRHPSELAAGAPAPAAWVAPAPPARRPTLALAGACLTGAALTCGLLWLTRPGWVRDEPTSTSRAAAVATTSAATFVAAGVPTTELADALAPRLVHVEAETESGWVSGTGLLLAEEGAVVVAAPLVHQAGFVAVTLADRRRIEADVVGTDAATGTARLAIDAAAPTDPLLASLARSGQAVAVVGARTGPDDAARQRVVPSSVSATGLRVALGDQVLHDALELDRALPADALGAAVVDAEGNLLGLVVEPNGPDGLAVAVPGRAALLAGADLGDDGEVQRAWLGVEATDLDAAAAARLEVEGGALLTAVDATSPAAAVGLSPGDVITEVDERPVRDASDLVLAIRAGQPGDEVELCWYRGTDEVRSQVTLGG